MEIRFLSATFGRLENETLSLKPGLNIIEAANESGKSTWMTFLRVMLYGLNTRDRSASADKRRYQPWSGSLMQGRLDLLSGSDSISIQRASRPGAPMSAFSATYTNTAASVPGLTAADCGGTLLGIPQEVFERSAYIRQSGISIDHSASLERRIASLITTGEEDSSYLEAAETLRRQLNRRRHNRTGQLPQLESEISALEETLSELLDLETLRSELETRHESLTQRETYLRHQLDLIESERSADRAAQITAARDKLKRMEAARSYAQRHAEALPSPEELSSLTAALDALRPLAQSALSARTRTEECEQELKKTEALLATQGFSPHTPEAAAQIPVPLPPRPKFPAAFFLLSGLCGVVAFLLVRMVFHLPTPTSLGAALIVAGLLFLTAGLLTSRRQRGWEDTAELLRRRHKADLGVYTKLYRTVEKHRSDLRTAKDAYRSLAVTYRTALNDALSAVQKFANVEDISAARKAIVNALACHNALAQATQAVKDARLRLELLSEQSFDTFCASTESPSMSREQAEAQLAALSEELTLLRRELHTTEGRIQTLGDSVLLQSELEEKRRRRAALAREYDAISLALEVLTSAGNTLQTRFSPALGEKSANIFTKLTRGKYNKVLLDRDMTPSAQESGSFLSHEALLLSQGTADQLYLAVRLAICDLVLPAEKHIPILLDDALVTFDDDRMAAALDYLVELSETRQVILFTCQKRELTYLSSAHPGRYHAITQTSAVS